MSSEELRAAVGDHPQTTEAWWLYHAAFNGFCETGLDPLFHRLWHPARSVGSLASMQGEAVLVFGTGPSALEAMPSLVRMRDRTRLFTSPRGAELLAAHGLVPDLVLVEHRTAIDAHHAARHVGDAGADPLRAVPLVAAEWRTPRALLAGVSPERLFVPDSLPTWGLWPATAVAVAADAGAARIGLIGIDLGTTDHADSAFAPLTGLLGLMSQLITADTIDCGSSGARKRGWTVGTLDEVAIGRELNPLTAHVRPAASPDERLGLMRERRRSLSPVVDRAREILAIGLRARGGGHVIGLESIASELLSWCWETDVRLHLQEDLGLSFLPRLWRTGLDLTLGAALWRPIVLATHELIGQAGRLDAIATQVAA